MSIRKEKGGSNFSGKKQFLDHIAQRHSLPVYSRLCQLSRHPATIVAVTVRFAGHGVDVLDSTGFQGNQIRVER